MAVQSAVCGLIVAIGILIVRPKTPPYLIVLSGLIIATVIYLVRHRISFSKEYFADNVSTMSSDDARVVRYGDIVSVWTLHNAFLKTNDTNIILSDTLQQPQDLPRGSYKVLFILEDPHEPTGPGNSNPVRFGSQVILSTFNSSYVTAADSGQIQTQATRDDTHNIFVVQGDAVGSSNIVRFGDSVYLQSASAGNNTFVTAGDDGSVKVGSRTSDARLSIQDRFGQGMEMDWGRRGETSQSSVYQNYNAYFAVDGKLLTYNQTQQELNAWWQVTLPKDIYIDRVIINNIPNKDDATKMKLSNFSIILTDSYGSTIARKNITTDSPLDQFAWSNVYRIARTVKIQLNDTVPQSLSMSSVQVYGLPVNFSILLNKPITTDLTTYATGNMITLDNARSKSFDNQELPVAHSGITLAFWINLDSRSSTDTSNYKSLLLKGSGSPVNTDGNKCPGVWISPGDFSLRVLVSTLQNVNDGIQKTNAVLVAGKNVHVTVVVAAGVSIGPAWQLGSMTPSGATTTVTVVMNAVQKRFYVLTTADASSYQNIFGKVTITPVDNLESTGYQNLGNFDKSQMSPTVKVYINGRQTDSVVLKGKPVFNEGALAFNSDMRVYAGLTDIKYSNYAMTDNQIYSLAMIKSANVCKSLLIGSMDASATSVVYSHSELPQYETELTLAGWVRFASQQAVSKLPILLKGTVDDPEVGILLWPTGDALNIAVRTASKIDGIDRPSLAIAQNMWYHLCMTIKDSQVTLYVNGVSLAVAALAGNITPVFKDMKLGGFNGMLQNCKMCNYAVDPSELSGIMGSHPEADANIQLKQIFQKMGCAGIPYNLDNNPGAAQDMKALLSQNKQDQVEKAFMTIKSNADAYLSGSTTADNKAALDMCYGDVAITGLAQTAGSSSCNTAPICLPTAPYTCPPQKDVNDFDIRTHKNFYKYVQTSNIRPSPGSTVATQASVQSASSANAASAAAPISSPTSSSPQSSPYSDDLLKQIPAASLQAMGLDPATATLQDISNALRNNPTVAQQLLTSGMTASNTSGTSNATAIAPSPVSGPPSPDAINAYLQSNPAAAGDLLGDLVQNTKDPAVVQSVLAGLAATQQVNMQDLLSHISATQMTDMLKTMVQSGQLSAGSVLQIMKNDSRLLAAITSMIKDGSLSMADIVNGLNDTPQLRNMLAQKCKSNSAAANSIYGTIASNSVDMSDYIRKDSLPCYKCNLSTSAQ